MKRVVWECSMNVDTELGLAGGDLSCGDCVASDKACSQNTALLTLLYHKKNDGLG